MADSKEFELLGSDDSSDMPKIIQGKIQYINEYINRNFQNKLSSSEMASKIGMTSSSFCRFYKKSTGKTFKRALNEVRIQNACYLLKDTNMPIENVALESGFTSIPLFYKFFNDIIQQKPSEYRIGPSIVRSTKNT
jgi:transcriptional regulator GlxA family with amidase domain